MVVGWKRGELEREDVVCGETGMEGNAAGSMRSNGKRVARREGSGSEIGLRGLMVLSLACLPLAAAQGGESCVSLAESSACPSFKDYQISTSLTDKYPFLAFVGNVAQFDTQFDLWVNQGYAQKQYKNRLGCANVDLSNTTSVYARFTKSVLCSALVHDSKVICGLNDPPTLCATSCADWATSEQIIAADNKTCGTTFDNAMDEIRSDFVICSLDTSNAALSDSCIQAASNEPNNCGFGDNLSGLCYYCAKQKETPTSTDACCYNANSETRCQNVELPDIPSLPPLPPIDGEKPASEKKKISGGAIAGIVIGSIIAIALIAILVVLCIKRRRQTASVYNHQGSTRQSSRARNNSMSFNPAPTGQGYEALPGRIARMSALEHNMSSDTASPAPVAGSRQRRRQMERSSSSDFGLEDSPESKSRTFTPENRPLHPPPRDRQASLSSASILMDTNNPSSPLSDSEKGATSPAYASPQSEQLQSFKDYYSKDDIRPGDKVAVLWAYAPRAPDEFELDRGDVLRVVGIWDDGWATGIRLNERAEDLSTRRRAQRDSGVSASQISQRQSRDRRASSPTPQDGQVKAFPLVCVCLPDHWQKTIENDGNTQSTPSSPGRGVEYGREGSRTPPSPEKKMPHKGSSRFNEDMNPPA